MTPVLNYGSLLLGFAAWVLAYFAIVCEKKKNAYCFSISSFSSCAISLLGQLLEVGNRVGQSDFSAIADTIRAIIIAACVMVIVTIVLNVVALRRMDKKQN